MAERRGYRETTHHITTQLQPVCGGAYGSSPFPTGPQTDGTWGAMRRREEERLGSATHQVVLGCFAVAYQAVGREGEDEAGKKEAIGRALCWPH